MNDEEYARLRTFLMRPDVMDAAARAEWKNVVAGASGASRWKDVAIEIRDAMHARVRSVFTAVLKRAARDASITRHPAGQPRVKASQDGNDKTPVGVPLVAFTRRWVCEVVRSGFHNGAGCTPKDPHGAWNCCYRTEASFTDHELGGAVRAVTPLPVRTQ